MNLETRRCGCRRWDLCEISCKHALSAISYQGRRIEDYVDGSYYVQTYLKVHELSIFSINSCDEWSKTGMPKLKSSLLLGSTKYGRHHINHRPDQDDPPSESKK